MKTFLITGGAGGIGSHIVTFLLGRGHQIIVWENDKKKLETLQNQIEKDKLGQVKFDIVDVSNSEQVKTSMAQIEALDVVINAAGVVWPIGKTSEIDLSKFKAAFEINFFGTLHLCYFAIPLLLKSAHGKIINFAGGGSASARENHCAYSCSKTAVVRLTENLAVEYPTLDINAIAPGAHKTPMWNDETFDQEPKQWSDMNELLEFINFLTSSQSKGITGKFLHFKDKRDHMLDAIKENADLYTLRRIDDFQFSKLTKL